MNAEEIVSEIRSVSRNLSALDATIGSLAVEARRLVEAEEEKDTEIVEDDCDCDEETDGLLDHEEAAALFHDFARARGWVTGDLDVPFRVVADAGYRADLLAALRDG